MKSVKEFTQRISYAILETTGCHVTIANKDLVRIAGTGEFEKKIGSNIPRGSAFEYSMLNKKTMIINEPGKNYICFGCESSEECNEKYEICTPIIKDKNPIGVIGLIATTDKEKISLERKEKSFVNYLENMAILLSSFVNEYKIKREIEIKNKELLTIIENTNHAIICITTDKKIKYINDIALELFEFDKNEIELENTKINDIWQNSLFEKILKGYGDCTVKEEEIYINKKTKIKKIVSSNIKKIYENNELVSLVGSFDDPIKLQKTAAKFIDVSFETNFESLLGKSSIFTETKEKAKVAAKYDSTILIEGESGTGKELFARAIHDASVRSDNPFVTVNCSAIPESLLESELFGYEGGIAGIENFGKIGKMELANYGTIFIEEIGNMTLFLQEKFLRALEKREIVRVGGKNSIKINLRVICSTKKNLEKLVNNGIFLEELYYRLNVISLKVPPLRKRESDIELLANYFLDKSNERQNKNIIGFEREAIHIMKDYSWPGNIRELENLIENILTFKKSGLITKMEISNRISTNNNHDSLDDMVKEFESNVIKELLDKYGNSKEGKKVIADKLNISRATLYRKISHIKSQK